MQQPSPLDPSASTTFRGKAYLNADNSLVADVLPAGAVSIFRTDSQFNPLAAVSEGPGRQQGAASSGMQPLMRVELQSADAGRYVYRVAVAAANATNTTTFVHPMGASLPRPLLPGERVVASCAWDYAGGALFVVWMDGTISKAVVRPPVGSCKPCF